MKPYTTFHDDTIFFFVFLCFISIQFVQILFCFFVCVQFLTIGMWFIAPHNYFFILVLTDKNVWNGKYEFLFFVYLSFLMGIFLITFGFEYVFSFRKNLLLDFFYLNEEKKFFFDKVDDFQWNSCVFKA